MKSINISELSEFDIEIKLKIILNDFYNGQTNLIDSSLKDCLNLIKNNETSSILLPNKLRVTKNGSTIAFNVEKNTSVLTTLMIIAFIGALIGTSYFGYSYFSNDNKTQIQLTTTKAEKVFIHYNEGATFNVEGVSEKTKAVKTIFIDNNSLKEAEYKINWGAIKNPFTTGNLKYNITVSGEGGYTASGVIVPSTKGEIASKIILPAKTSHSYNIEVYLEAADRIQDEDKDKKFSGMIEIILTA